MGETLHKLNIHAMVHPSWASSGTYNNINNINIIILYVPEEPMMGETLHE